MSRSIRNNPEAKKAAAKRVTLVKERRNARRGDVVYTLDPKVVDFDYSGWEHENS